MYLKSIIRAQFKQDITEDYLTLDFSKVLVSLPPEEIDTWGGSLIFIVRCTIIMEITRCVLANGMSRPCRQFVRARKIRIAYNITVCTTIVGRMGHTETLLVMHRVTRI